MEPEPPSPRSFSQLHSKHFPPPPSPGSQVPEQTCSQKEKEGKKEKAPIREMCRAAHALRVRCRQQESPFLVVQRSPVFLVTRVQIASVIAARVWYIYMSGSMAIRFRTIPATRGEAMEVPLLVCVSVFLARKSRWGSSCPGENAEACSR